MLKSNENTVENTYSPAVGYRKDLLGQTEGKATLRKINTSLGIHVRGKSAPASSGHYKHCIGCQSILMKQ